MNDIDNLKKEIALLKKQKLDYLNWLKSELQKETQIKLDKVINESRVRFINKAIKRLNYESTTNV